MDARNSLPTSVVTLVMGAVMSTARGQAFTFDPDTPGAPPHGWLQGVTGAGAARWAIAADHDAPSPPNVLMQTGVGAFPWIVRPEVALQDGYVEAPVPRGRRHVLQVDLAGTRIRK